MIKRNLFFALLLTFFVQTAFSQATDPKANAEKSAEMKKQAVEFLRETAGDVGNLRTLENRIGFAAEIAGLMWFHDEREARAMMNAAVGDFKQLIMQYDSQLGALGEPDGNQSYYGGFLGGDQSDRARLTRKLMKAMSVRQQIAMSIGEHDPQLAFDFYEGGLLMLSNAKLRKQFEDQDGYFMTRMLNQIAAKDAGKAADLARRSLDKGVNYQHIELLGKIWEKDADKGADFAEAMAKKLKDTKADSEDYYMIGSMVNLTARNFETAKKDKKKPMLSEQQLRDLTETLAQVLLKSPDGRGTEYLAEIEKYAPARAVQIRARNNNSASNVSNSSYLGTSNSMAVASNSSGSMPPPPPPVGARPSPTPVSPEVRLAENVKKFENKELPKEEREKVIAEARKIITEIPNKTAKITALSGLAAQIYRFGDRELAAQIMTEAQGLVNLQPKNVQDYMEIWILASGYAQGDADKAFPILEDTIFRLNSTISAFIKVAEFIDVSGEIIEDGEVQVGSFGGSMVRDLTGGLGMASGTLRSLAETDFAKTRGLTNRFEHQEVRILAKMLVLRAVLGDEKKGSEGEAEGF